MKKEEFKIAREKLFNSEEYKNSSSAKKDEFLLSLHLRLLLDSIYDEKNDKND